MTVTAAWPLPRLISAYARAGWGDLDTGAAQGIRSTLRALADILPDGSASGTVTRYQVADAAGLSLRWTSRCLTYLEAAGLITWTRGRVIAGKPTPGMIRVHKKRIALLVRRARHDIDDRLRARAAETSKRIRETLRTGWQPNTTPHRPEPARRPRFTTPAQRNPLSVHGELRAPLPPNGEETGPTRPPVTPPPTGISRAALLRQAIHQQRATA